MYKVQINFNYLKTCYFVAKNIYSYNATVKLFFRNYVNTHCIKDLFGYIVLRYLVMLNVG